HSIVQSGQAAAATKLERAGNRNVHRAADFVAHHAIGHEVGRGAEEGTAGPEVEGRSPFAVPAGPKAAGREQGFGGCGTGKIESGGPEGRVDLETGRWLERAAS